MASQAMAQEIYDIVKALTWDVQQMDDHGLTPDVADELDDGGLPLAAAALALTAAAQSDPDYTPASAAHDVWPWGLESFQPHEDAVRNLTRACAILIVEIARRRRAAKAAGEGRP